MLKALDELAAHRARDEAERDNAKVVIFPAELLALADADAGVAHLVDGEARLRGGVRLSRPDRSIEFPSRMTACRNRQVAFAPFLTDEHANSCQSRRR